MNGVAHASIGAGIGVGISLAVQGDVMTSGFIIAASTISALVPDLDTRGKLTNKLILSPKIAPIALILLAFFISKYHYSTKLDISNWKFLLIGLFCGIILRVLSYRVNLCITGLIFITLGIYLSGIMWLILAGVYIVLASLLPHRSYTHTLIGLIFYGYIAYLFSNSVQIPILLHACVLGYISHLVADMKFIPGNKRGVKLFKPLFDESF